MGKGLGSKRYFKLQMYNSGLMYSNVKVALDKKVSYNRRLMDKDVDKDEQQPREGSSIDVPVSRGDVIELVAAALNCGNNVSEGIASTLITGSGFSLSTTNYINMSKRELAYQSAFRVLKKMRCL